MNTPPKETLGELVRDLTKVHPIPKSQVRRRIQEYVNNQLSQILADYDKAVIGKDEKVTRIDRKTDDDTPKESRNDLREEQRQAAKVFKEGLGI